MSKSTFQGRYYQKMATAKIKERGQLLTVERWPDGARSATLTQTVWMIPMADNESSQSVIMAEGDLNTSNAQTVQFVIVAQSDVREVVDRVIYRGFYYKIAIIVPTGDHSGVVASWTARAVRDGKVN